MRKSWTLLALPAVIVIGTPPRPDPVASEVAELHDQIEAMKRHPSIVRSDPGAESPAEPFPR